MLAAFISALILTAVAASAAFAAPVGYPAEGPSAGATATPDPHASMSGMDPNMPGMIHEATTGMDPNMPGMTHEATTGMDPNMPGMTHEATTGMDPNMPGMSGSSGHAHTAAAGSDSRPQAAVVGTFAVVNGGVLLTAGLMRRRAEFTAKPSRATRPAK
ncbi:hypothetical protein [Propionicimonas paludicola]|uniref:hypothetical protein n=1 Tax=Propionicimonas paludicola TaxID=185243 RepID=UPI00117B03D9|nr:hypothetical protein [Propionicimonas paludicola]